ncbi:MAG TPA: hypothetical protein VHZ33_31775 [Trebonia sp.]|nr:hypothetical protein [Trebonia sp.]
MTGIVVGIVVAVLIAASAAVTAADAPLAPDEAVAAAEAALVDGALVEAVPAEAGADEAGADELELAAELQAAIVSRAAAARPTPTGLAGLT